MFTLHTLYSTGEYPRPIIRIYNTFDLPLRNFNINFNLRAAKPKLCCLVMLDSSFFAYCGQELPVFPLHFERSVFFVVVVVQHKKHTKTHRITCPDCIQYNKHENMNHQERHQEKKDLLVQISQFFCPPQPHQHASSIKPRVIANSPLGGQSMQTLLRKQ